MKVLQINRRDNTYHGADVSMHRLQLGLIRAGISSKLLCGKQYLKSPYSEKIPRSRKVKRIEHIVERITSPLGLNDIHRVRSFGVRKSEAYLDADILHIHNLHGGFFCYLALPRLTENKPVVFTLHDMWAFTGHCGHSYDCDRWRIGCGKCPYPDVDPPIKRDGTRIEWKLKNWVYGRSNLTIVAPSTWMAQKARQSMLSRFPIYQIPHGVDTQVFEPLDSDQCRSMLGIRPGKKVLLFGAANLQNQGKGADLLLKALQRLPESLKVQTVLLIFGERGEAITETAGIQTLDLGYVSSDRLKAMAYSAADLFVFPTRAETLGLVLIESMACGTPMVSFRVGGVTDVVRPGITGYLAEPENAKDLCHGIVQLLEDEPLRKHMSEQCRAIALKEYSLDLHVQRHIELYQQLLQNR